MAAAEVKKGGFGAGNRRFSPRGGLLHDDLVFPVKLDVIRSELNTN